MFWPTIPVAELLVVTTGTLSPINILAFSLFLVRMLGLASTCPSPSSRFKFKIKGDMAAPSREGVRFFKSSSVKPVAALFEVSGVRVREDGTLMPRLSKRDLDISNTSTSSRTSGSGMSCSAISLSASATTSADSRRVTELARSSTKGSAVFKVLRSMLAAVLASVCVR